MVAALRAIRLYPLALASPYDLSANLSREGRLVVEGRYREIDHQYEKAIEVYRVLFTLFPDNADYGLRLAGVQVRGAEAWSRLGYDKKARQEAKQASAECASEYLESAAMACCRRSRASRASNTRRQML